jgi:hypothetical protein
MQNTEPQIRKGATLRFLPEFIFGTFGLLRYDINVIN